jgi:hypothetical protein
MDYANGAVLPLYPSGCGLGYTGSIFGLLPVSPKALYVQYDWECQQGGGFILGNMTYAIESIKKSVEQVSGCNLDRLIDLVIDLVQSDRLRIDQGIT